MTYRYRLRKDIGVSFLFLEKDSITLTREWFISTRPLLETQLKNLIEAEWGEAGIFRDLWTDPPQEKKDEAIPIVEVLTPVSVINRDQAIKDAMKRLFNKSVEMIHLPGVEDELP